MKDLAVIGYMYCCKVDYLYPCDKRSLNVLVYKIGA